MFKIKLRLLKILKKYSNTKIKSKLFKNLKACKGERMRVHIPVKLFDVLLHRLVCQIMIQIFEVWLVLACIRFQSACPSIPYIVAQSSVPIV